MTSLDLSWKTRIRKYRYNINRQLTVLWRHIRFSQIVCWGQKQEKKLEALHKIYQTTNRFLKDLEVDYWLIHGSLLGQYRHGEPIATDLDIDFAATEDSYTKILNEASRLPKEFKLADSSFNHYGPKIDISYMGWRADIYFYQDQGSTIKTFEKDARAGYETPIPKDWIFPLQTTAFWGEITNIPFQSEKVLKNIYGYIGCDAIQDRQTGYWVKNPIKE